METLKDFSFSLMINFFLTSFIFQQVFSSSEKMISEIKRSNQNLVEVTIIFFLKIVLYFGLVNTFFE